MVLVFVLVKYNNSVENHSNGWTWARRKYALRERLFSISMRIPPHPKKYQAKNLISRPSGWHLPQQDSISLLLSVSQFHIEKELSRVTGPFVFAIVLSDSPESSPGRCTRTAFPARSSSLSLAPHTPEHKAKERNSNQGRLQDSHYVTNVSCASDNQLRGSQRGFDGISVRILCLMPWERALGVVKV